jgi:hypothetical protein
LQEVFITRLDNIDKDLLEVEKQGVDDLLKIDFEDPSYFKDIKSYKKAGWLDAQFSSRERRFKSILDNNQVHHIKFLSWLSRSDIYSHDEFEEPTKEEKKKYKKVQVELRKLVEQSFQFLHPVDFLIFVEQYSFNKSWIEFYSTLTPRKRIGSVIYHLNRVKWSLYRGQAVRIAWIKNNKSPETQRKTHLVKCIKDIQFLQPTILTVESHISDLKRSLKSERKRKREVFGEI